MDTSLANFIALWIAVGLLTAVVVLLVRQIGIITIRLPPVRGPLQTAQGLDVGSVAPAFQAMDLATGGTVRFPELLESGLLLFFVSPTCAPCQEFIPTVADFWRNGREKDLQFLMVSSGDPETNREFVRQYDVPFPFLIQDDEQGVGELFGVKDITPYTFAIDSDGLVRFGGLVQQHEQLELLASMLAEPYDPDHTHKGQPVDLLEEVASND